MNTPIYLDKLGYEQYLLQLQQAEDYLVEIRKYKGEVAIFQGDAWHDNPTLYQTEMNERIAIKSVADLKEGLRNIILVERKKNADNVAIGDIITIIFQSSEQSNQRTFKLIAASPTNIGEEVSINSPLGKAIWGRNIGECVEYIVRNDKIQVKIIKII